MHQNLCRNSKILHIFRNKTWNESLTIDFEINKKSLSYSKMASFLAMLLLFTLVMWVSKVKTQQNTLGISIQKLQLTLNQSSTGFIFQPFSVLLYFVAYGLSLLVPFHTNIQKILKIMFLKKMIISSWKFLHINLIGEKCATQNEVRKLSNVSMEFERFQPSGSC